MNQHTATTDHPTVAAYGSPTSITPWPASLMQALFRHTRVDGRQYRAPVLQAAWQQAAERQGMDPTQWADTVAKDADAAWTLAAEIEAHCWDDAAVASLDVTDAIAALRVRYAASAHDAGAVAGLPDPQRCRVWLPACPSAALATRLRSWLSEALPAMRWLVTSAWPDVARSAVAGTDTDTWMLGRQHRALHEPMTGPFDLIIAPALLAGVHAHVQRRLLAQFATLLRADASASGQPAAADGLLWVSGACREMALRAGWRATGPGPLLRPPLAAQPVAEATFSLLANPATPAAHTAAASAPAPAHSSQAPVQLMLALASEGAELQYLPQYGNGDGRLAGAEAVLCRKLDGLLVPWWRGGQALSAPTADPVLLNHWVLSKACRQAAAWARQGLATLTMVVPVSAEYLQHPGFVDGLCRVLDQTGLPPEQLTLAVGGRTLAHWQPALLPTLAECRRLGVRISLARLRAGDTLMGLLHRLPIDEIRIDGPLLAQVPGDAQAEATVRRIATLGRDLGLRVVAEGVQHGEQRRWLASLHCDAFQGPLAGPALAAPAFEQLAASAAPTEPAVLEG